MNLKRTMYKLQTALCQQGRYIAINQRQWYSEEAGRMITKYRLVENGEREPLFEGYSTADVVKFLANELGGG